MRPTVAYVNLAAIRHNLHVIRESIGPDAQIIAVVKANAYGHGAIPVSHTLLLAGATSLAVALPEEGEQLRQAGITVPILVLGLSLPEVADHYVEHGLTATVSTLEGVTALAQAARKQGSKASVMVKLDTGMSRIGLPPDQMIDFVQRITMFPEIELRGIFTHLATADAYDKTLAYAQLVAFEQVLSKLTGTALIAPIVSAANSATIIDLPRGIFSAVRPGIILYGLSPSNEMHHKLDLQPAMELKTKIVYIKQVPRGTSVSYGSTYTTTKNVYLATLPIGYADGYSRHLSNKAPVLINGIRRKVVGRVCMDQIIVELGETCDAQIGDEAVLFGRQGTEEITVTELAHLAGTINYELVCAVSARVPRVYLNE